MRAVPALPPINPVLRRELRQRMRGRAAWVVLTLYTSVLGLLLWLVYRATTNDTLFGPGGDAVRAAAAGRSVFHWLLFFMLGLICFIVPGLTAGAITGERERQTLVPLQVTLLAARSIVVGKLLASLAFVVLLVLATLPLIGVSFLLGGVAVTEVVKGVAVVLLVAVALAAVGIGCSSALRRTQSATVTAYGITMMLVIGTLIAYGAQRTFDDSPAGVTKPFVLALNPFAVTADVVRGQGGGDDLFSPFRPLQSLLDEQVVTERELIAPADGEFPAPVPAPFLRGPIVAEEGEGQIGRFGPDGFPVEQRARLAGMPFWMASVLAFAAVAALGVAIASRRLRVPAVGAST